MQYMVPQFTDVEDRIIGPLTVKQFGIIFGAGVLIFLAYQASKSVAVLVVFFFLVGLPAVILSFAKINGREVYKTIPIFLKFAFGPKYLVFHKEAFRFHPSEKLAEAENLSFRKNMQDPGLPNPKSAEPKSTKERLLEVNRLLQQQALEEEELIKGQKS